MLLQWMIFMQVLCTWFIWINQWLWAFTMPWSLGSCHIRPTSKRWFLKIIQTIHSMPCRNPRGLYIHIAFTYFVGPLNVVWSELGPTPASPPMGVREVWWSWSLGLVCEVTLRSLIGWKGLDCPSSLHARRWRPNNPTMLSWMKNLDGFLHGKT